VRCAMYVASSCTALTAADDVHLGCLDWASQVYKTSSARSLLRLLALYRADMSCRSAAAHPLVHLHQELPAGQLGFA
jgi:hypothetical protein